MDYDVNADSQEKFMAPAGSADPPKRKSILSMAPSRMWVVVLLIFNLSVPLKLINGTAL